MQNSPRSPEIAKLWKHIAVMSKYSTRREAMMASRLQFMNAVCVGLLFVVVCLGAGHVWSGVKMQKELASVNKLHMEIAALHEQLADRNGRIDELNEELLPKRRRVAAIATYLESDHNLSATMAERYAKAFVENSIATGMPDTKLIAITWKETDFRDRVTSENGSSHGAMQVNLYYWKDYFKTNKKELYVLEKNVEFGSEILRYNYALSKGNMRVALKRYRGATDIINEQYADDVTRRSYIVTHRLQSILRTT